MSTWQIMEETPDHCDIARGGRGVAYDAGDLDACRNLIRKNRRFDPKLDRVIYYPLEGAPRIIRKV